MHMKKLFKDTNLNVHMDPIHLSFSDEKLEASYLDEQNHSSILMIRFGIVLAFLLFSVYGIVDLYTYPSAYQSLWGVRVLMDLFLISFFIYSYQKSYLKHLQMMNIFAVHVLGFALVYLFSFEIETDFVYIFVSSYVLLIIGSFSLFGLKFFNALLSNLFIMVFIGIVFYFQFDLISNVLYGILFLSVICITIVSSYLSEIEKRKLFLKEIYSSEILSELKNTQIELKERADKDYLTGLYNRRYLTSIAQKLIKIAKRKKYSMSIILMDIDRFKHINDTYGHAIGDEVLKEISTLLTENIRESDVLARFGGEEFSILLPETDKDAAYVLADKLRVIIENNIFVFDDEIRLGVTISGGVESIDVNVEKDIDIAINKADKALYRAKESGRNRILQ